MEAETLTPLDRAMMLSSWQRRKKWEADVQAMALLKMLGDALGSPSPHPSPGGRRGGRRRVEGATMMALAGKELAGKESG